MNERILRVNQLIRTELGKIINEELEFPGIIVTVTAVHTAKDLRNANIYISVIPDGKTGTVLKKLEANKKNFHQLLNKNMVIRNVPRLRFVVDKSGKKAAEMDLFLDNLQ